MKKAILILLPICIALAITVKIFITASRQQAEVDFHKGIPNTIVLGSDAFPNNGIIPTLFTGKGESKSPELHWSNLPEGTKSLVLLMTDYDGPAPFLKLTIVDHWVVYNIPANMTALGAKVDSIQLAKDNIGLGINYTKGIEYAGPKPPIGVHRYFFRVYALSVPLLNLVCPKKQEVMDVMKGNVLAYGELIGRY